MQVHAVEHVLTCRTEKERTAQASTLLAHALGQVWSQAEILHFISINSVLVECLLFLDFILNHPSMLSPLPLSLSFPRPEPKPGYLFKNKKSNKIVNIVIVRNTSCQ